MVREERIPPGPVPSTPSPSLPSLRALFLLALSVPFPINKREGVLYVHGRCGGGRIVFCVT